MADRSESDLRLGISHQRPDELTPERFRYLRQMGVQAMEVRLPEAAATYDELCRIRDVVADAGIELFEVMPADIYDFPGASVGGPGADDEIRRFIRFLNDLNRAGIRRTTYAWRTGGAYQTGRATHRESDTRRFSLADAERSRETAAGPAAPVRTDARVDEDEAWQNYARFLGEVVPAAEDAGVFMQLHPNDPPVTHLGIARLFRSTDAFRRAIDLAGGSASAGILFCVGTFGEMAGPDGSGEDVDAALREFIGAGRVEQVHFRNVSSPLPDFIETYPDAGYLNMARIVRTLREAGFQGMIVPDHVPLPFGAADPRALAEAYVFGYIRALIQSSAE